MGEIKTTTFQLEIAKFKKQKESYIHNYNLES